MSSSLKEIENEIAALTKKIFRYNDLYYNKNISEISDYEYDKLLRHLRDLEIKYPHLKKLNSPTDVIGVKISNKFDEVVHKVKMESLQDAFSFDELKEFDRRVRSKISDVSYVVEPKVDGLSVSLEYVNGEFVRGSTRGDGFVGEDVTDNLKVIESVPQKLFQKIEFLEVRAEVFMPPEKFEQLNFNSANKKFQNPRNAASGSLRQKDAERVKERGLEAVVFNVQQVRGVKLLSHFDSIKFLNSLGFKTIPESDVFFSIEQCVEQIKIIDKNRSSYEFEIDGAVVKINSFSERLKLGSTARFPRWAVAYKYKPEQKQTRLLSIEINVGRTGVLTPVAVFEPVNIAKTVVSRASLHNQSFISSNNIRIGDLILVRKAGEIIPEVVKSVEHVPNSSAYFIPDFCPVCGSRVVKSEKEVAVRCVNSNCRSTLVWNIIYFASKVAMNIDGLGKAVVNNLVEQKLVRNFVDLFRLTKEDLLKLNGFSEKSASKLIDSIKKSKKAPLWRLICGLGIRGVGENVAKLVCKSFKNIFEIERASLSDFLKIDGLGQVVCSGLVEFFSLGETQKLISDFEKLGLNLVSESYENENLNGRFSGLVFAVTGKLERFSRGEVKEVIEKNGGEFASDVNRKVSFLIVGERAGSKVEKAKKLKLKVINETDFLKLLG